MLYRVAGIESTTADRGLLFAKAKAESTLRERAPLTRLFFFMYDIDASANTDAENAAYKLTDVRQQMQAYTEDVLRSFVSRTDVDDVFLVSKELAGAVFEQTAPRMLDCGYEIENALVTGIEPEASVKHSMNEIERQKRRKAAAVFLAEGSKASLAERHLALSLSLSLAKFPRRGSSSSSLSRLGM